MTYDPPPTKKVPKKLGDYFKRLERKGLVRIVRTPAGAKRYGQPIGSVIVLDAVPGGGRERRAHKRIATMPDAPTVVYDEAAARRPAAKKAPAKKAPAKRATPSRATKKASDAISEDKNSGFAWMSPTYGVDNHGRTIQIFDHGGNNISGRWSDRMLRTDIEVRGSSVEEVKEKLAQMHLDRHRRMFSRSTKPTGGKRHRNPKARPEGNLLDTYPGIRGVDWMYDDDEAPGDDEEKRIALAHKDAEDMGFRYSNYLGRDLEFDVNIMESMNAVFNAHNDEYPGFMKHFVDDVTIDGRGLANGAVAWNRIEPSYYPGQRHRATIGVGAKFAALGYEDRKSGSDVYQSWEATSDKRDPDLYPVGWLGVNAENLAENMGVETWEAMLTAVITHELGHSVARVMFNEFSHNRVGDRHSGDESYTGSFFREDFLKILKKYDFLGPYFPEEQDTDEQRRRQNRMLSSSIDDMAPNAINREAIKEHVSVYGSYNFHEMLAETWSIYQLDEKPSEFVREMGALMESLVVTYIDESEKAAAKAEKDAKRKAKS